MSFCKLFKVGELKDLKANELPGEIHSEEKTRERYMALPGGKRRVGGRTRTLKK